MVTEIFKLKNSWNNSLMAESSELEKENNLFAKLAPNFQSEIRIKRRQKNSEVFLSDVAKLETAGKQMLAETIQQIDGGRCQEITALSLMLIQLTKDGHTDILNQVLKREIEKGNAPIVISLVSQLSDIFGLTSTAPEILEYIEANQPSDIAKLRKKEKDLRYYLELISIIKSSVLNQKFIPIFDDFYELKPNQKSFYLAQYKSLSHFEKQRNQRFIPV